MVALLPLIVGCGAPSPKEVAESSDYALAREHGRYVSIAGIDTFAITVGTGPDIVLIHGNPSSTYSWRHFIPALAEQHRVHALDLPGYGFSAKPADAPYTASWQAGHVAAYMDAAGIESAIVVGNSMGGEIASEVAAIYPRRVRGLVLIAPGGLPSGEIDSPPLAIRLAMLPGANVFAPLFPIRPLLASTLRDAYFDPALVTDADIDAYSRPLQSRGGLTAFLARMSRDDTVDRSTVVKTIQAPTLVVLGEVDRLVPLSVGRAYHDLIAGSQLVVIERAGHVPQEERPEATLAVVDRFIRSVPQT
jgi:pimeloyl-ACP methyl ester carboxylesterase